MLLFKKAKLITFFIFIILIFSYTSNSFADTSFRCKKELISLEDDQIEILQKCGNPVLKIHKYFSFTEIWTYNLGKNKFMKRVTLVKGKVTHIEGLTERGW